MAENVLGSVEFSLHIERLKIKNDFSTYIETLTYFVENETDMEYSEVIKNLSKSILTEVEIEARSMKLLKDNGTPVSIEHILAV